MCALPIFPGVGQPSDRGTGATIAGNASGYTYTTRDGTVYAFSPAYFSDFYRSASQRAETITYPDGHVLTLSYELAHPEFCKPTTHECRSEERRGGKECVSTCRSRRSPYH